MVDVVVSNCVLNLVPDKRQAFSEVLRVLKPGGRFSISDVVLHGELPAALKEAAAMYAGCVAGALQEDEYLSIIQGLGFADVKVEKRKPITVPDDILRNFLGSAELASFKAAGTGIFSITVSAVKPGLVDQKTSESQACCTPGGSCC